MTRFDSEWMKTFGRLMLRNEPTVVMKHRQLVEHCPRRIILEEIADEYNYSSGYYAWKVTIGGRQCVLSFDEMLGQVAHFARPHIAREVLYGMKSEAEEQYEDRIQESHYKLKHLGCFKESPLDNTW